MPAGCKLVRAYEKRFSKPFLARTGQSTYATTLFAKLHFVPEVA